jgi:hypothetical protein
MACESITPPNLIVASKQNFACSNNGSPDPLRNAGSIADNILIPHELHDVTEQYFPHLTEAGMLPRNSNHLTEAGLRRFTVAIPDAIQQFTGYISALALAICLLQNNGRFVRRLSARFSTTG